MTFYENRIIFDERMTWITKTDCDDTLSKIAAAGFNVYVPAVWGARGVTWPTNITDPVLGGTNKVQRDFLRWNTVDPLNPDPLAYLIQQAHARGIEVHPWFTVANRNPDPQAPQWQSIYCAAAAVFGKNPQTLSGTPVDKTNASYDVHNSAFRIFFTSLVTEVATNYAVDGIVLDYIRSVTYGTDSSHRGSGGSPVGSYNQVTGRTLCTADNGTGGDLASSTVGDDGSGNFNDPTVNNALTSWQSPMVEDIVSRCRTALKSAKPNAILSAATFAGDYLFAKPQGQNAVALVNAGRLDVAIGMKYKPISDASQWTTLMNAVTDMSEPREAIIMIATYQDEYPTDPKPPRDAQTVVDLVRWSQAWGMEGNGVAVYGLPNIGTPWDYLNNDVRAALAAGPFATPATPRWRVNTTELPPFTRDHRSYTVRYNDGVPYSRTGDLPQTWSKVGGDSTHATIRVSRATLTDHLGLVSDTGATFNGTN